MHTHIHIGIHAHACARACTHINTDTQAYTHTLQQVNDAFKGGGGADISQKELWVLKA